MYMILECYSIRSYHDRCLYVKCCQDIYAMDIMLMGGVSAHLCKLYNMNYLYNPTNMIGRKKNIRSGFLSHCFRLVNQHIEA